MLRVIVLAGVAGLVGGACTFTPPSASGGGDGGGETDGPPVDPTDPDGDGKRGDEDNCPDDANSDQLDDDNDGVGNACDNCQGLQNRRVATMGSATPIQRDHDGDGLGDACDPCPHLPFTSGADNDDSDGDGTGAACDPEPAVANPAPYFNGFYDELEPEWRAVAGAGARSDWVIALHDGKPGLRQTMTDAGRHQLLLDDGRQEQFIQTSFVIDGITPADGNTIGRSATVSYGFGRNGLGEDIYFSCGLRRDLVAGTSSIIATVQKEDVDDDAAAALWSGGDLNVVLHVTAVGTRTGSTQPNQGSSALSCAAVSNPAPVTATNTNPTFPDGQVGLRTFGTTAWFDYIFIVDPRPGP